MKVSYRVYDPKKVEEEGDSEYDRNFWEEEVDPSFEILQERLDKVMKEI